MIIHESVVHAVGFLAAAATICAFYCRNMMCLRVAAIGANMLFIVYGAMLMLIPVLALHVILLPLNMMRLSAFLRERKAALPPLRTALPQTD